VDLNDYLRLLRKRWRLILLCALVGVGAAAAYASTAAPGYTASSRLFVSTQGGTDTLQNALSGSQFSQNRVKSYADIVNTPAVTAPVIAKLGLVTTPAALASEISASAPLDTVLVDVTAKSGSAAEAQALANAVAAQLVTVVNDLEMPAGGGASPVKLSVVTQASLPTGPVSPKKKLDLALGLLVGLAVGVAGSVLRETLDTTIRTAEDFQVVAPGVSTLGFIGFDGDAARRPLIVEVSPHSPRAEAFRQLRTNLQFVDPDHPLRSLVVTSAIPREGKSTTTANLAITLARAGVSVLLVEGDLRRPRMGRYLNVPQEALGLSDLLVGRAVLDQVVGRYGEDGPYILPAGSTPPNPSELLGSSAMAELMGELTTRFNIVLIDAPPLLPVTDAAVLSRVTDGVLYVMHAGSTKREQVKRALESLRAVEAHVLGVVFNMVNSKGPDAFAGEYGYYGYYDYYGDNAPNRHWWSRRRLAAVVPGPLSPTAAELPSSPRATLSSPDVTGQTGNVLAGVSPTDATPEHDPDGTAGGVAAVRSVPSPTP